jgi:hypothetical protein
MDVCPRVSVLCCPVSVEALHWADPPSKESYQNVSICRLRSPLGMLKQTVMTTSTPVLCRVLYIISHSFQLTLK